MSEQQKWDDILEAEGLGVIEVDGPYQGTNLKHIKGKWARLDAEINNLQSKSEVMTNSPQTARGFATRSAGNSDDAGGHMSGFGDDDYLTGNLRMVTEDYDDGLSDFETLGDDLWDSMALAVTASPKEAEIADRRRASVSGLDKWGRPNQPEAQAQARARARQRGARELHERDHWRNCERRVRVFGSLHRRSLSRRTQLPTPATGPCLSRRRYVPTRW